MRIALTLASCLALAACDSGSDASGRTKGKADRKHASDRNHQDDDATEAESGDEATDGGAQAGGGKPNGGESGGELVNASAEANGDENDDEGHQYHYVVAYKASGTIGFTNKTFPFAQDVSYDITRETIKATTANSRAERREVAESLQKKDGTKVFTRPTPEELSDLRSKPNNPYASCLLLVKSVRLANGGETTFDPPLPALVAQRTNYKMLEGKELRARSTANGPAGSFVIEWTVKLTGAGTINLHKEIVDGPKDLGEKLEATGLPQDMTLHVDTTAGVFSRIEVNSYYKNSKLEGSPADLIGTAGFPSLPGGPDTSGMLAQMSARQPVVSAMNVCSFDNNGKTKTFNCQ